MQSAADELEIVDLHLAGELADEVIGSARSHPAIDRGNDIAAAGELLVSSKASSAKKRDVDDVFLPRSRMVLSVLKPMNRARRR